MKGAIVNSKCLKRWKHLFMENCIIKWSTIIKLDKIIGTVCMSDKGLGKLQGWQLVGLSPSTRDPAQALGVRAGSQPLDHQGIPSRLVINNGVSCYYATRLKRELHEKLLRYITVWKDCRIGNALWFILNIYVYIGSCIHINKSGKLYTKNNYLWLSEITEDFASQF